LWLLADVVAEEAENEEAVEEAAGTVDTGAGAGAAATGAADDEDEA
jgi:hypothetical protein